ncbi:AAA-ATPase At3g28510-like [Selaginella moellendorffii]|uniref:AAA-ATPase At3g28510-like n=1 Tax=Selaginella moellendorffii TaxID=88036 RepID=UPI000D1C9FE8|nr:AAA-ATPase At3g28510-like [Selaginella moellendorffii]|eukprot:XP_024525242.1 AAA-ATPase At3g28510-like [Selaginella moellendorffii]
MGIPRFSSELKRGIMRGSSEVAYLGSILGLLAFLQAILPREIWYVLQEWVRKLLLWVSFYIRVDVYELDDNHSNEIYDAVKLHIASITADQHASARRLTISKAKGAVKPSFRPATNEQIVDTFQGVQFWWVHRVKPLQPKGSSPAYWGQSRSDEKRYFTLTLHRRYRQSLLPAYLDHIAENAKELDRQNRARKLYTNAQSDGRRPWEYVPFKHPATFKSMAIDDGLKRKIMDDLNAFKVGQSFYDRVGRAWKRGYLLYGPPGTGKSSLIAAIANFTDYDVYDLELTEVKSNAELRRLLMNVKNKSVIVIEDIDCSLELQNRGLLPKDVESPAEEELAASADQRKKKEKADRERSRVTLSGVLNFTDGLWSSIGDERILIFTTNHIDQLDPALLRSGRMDFHILMTYCSFQAFKVLASTYLLLDDHELFVEIEELLGAVQITPADVAEVFIQYKNKPDAALEKLIKELQARTSGGGD